MDISQLIQAIVLGIVQGVTEWLPVSSKAMVSLVLITFFNPDVSLSEAVYYAIWLHIGTLFAVVLYYRDQVVRIIRNLPHYLSNVSNRSWYNRLTTFLIIATFCTGLIGARPAMARANVSIATGAAGSDVAIETADIA